jgi:putative transposase
VPARVSPSQTVRAQIDELFADPDRELGAILEEVARLSVRLVIQAALEAEVTAFLGRDRYARTQRARAGSRNGYTEVTVKTTTGPVTLKRPTLRGTDETFASRLLGKHVTRTNAPAGAGHLRMGARGVGPGRAGSTRRDPRPRRPR